MSLVCFEVPNHGRHSSEHWTQVCQRAYLATWDGLPISDPGVWRQGLAVFSLRVGESGYLHMPWTTAGGRSVTLVSNTVLARVRPYALDVELARGTLGRVLNWWEEWKRLNWPVPPALALQLHEASGAFAEAVTSPHHPLQAAEYAARCLDWSLDALTQLTTLYVGALRQSAPKSAIHRHAVRFAELPLSLPQGDEADAFMRTFQGVWVAPRVTPETTSKGWRTAEEFDAPLHWNGDRFRTRILGPCVDFRDPRSPDPSEVIARAKDWGARYHERVNLWYAAAGLDGLAGPQGDQTPERTHILQGVITGIRESDPGALVLVGIRDPWGRYLLDRPDDPPPVEMARHAFRAGLGISALGLEIGLGYSSTNPSRDELAILNLIDFWSQFNVPLVIFLSPEAAGDRGPPADNFVLVDDTLRRLLPLLTTHPRIMAVGWSPWRESSQPGDPPGMWRINTGGTPRLASWKVRPGVGRIPAE